MLDVLSLARHTRYFNQTRSFLIFQRIRLLTLLLAVLQTGWVLVDQLLLPAQMQTPIALGRFVSGVALLALLFWYQRPYDLRFALARLFLLLAILSVFQTWSNLLLLNSGQMSAVAGYQFFPFMIVTMLAIFPLTIVEVSAVTGVVILVELLTQISTQRVGMIEEINDLWLLLVLGTIAGWAAVNQLSMLLGLYRQATRDALTGLANRRQVMEQLEGDVEDARARGEPISILLFDLDKFKGFNDNYGHAAGDIVLKQFARILRKQARGKRDLAGRFGGEEFLTILPGADSGTACKAGEEICNSCRQTQVRIPSGEMVGFTTSIGIATLEPGESPSELLRRADEALYQAKADGRDGYVLAGPQDREGLGTESTPEVEQEPALSVG
ncbi:GGDEF domain-containing protein [Marinobacterium ramblicola]|uniref:GGDEF domain-containing protein n=1 Tax=Marinobacterium ramblicola TaxID=2849041 RepID=UPI001FE71998|nr:GGDEF domain-containing protein [Marinobacterium ramblicola]